MAENDIGPVPLNIRLISDAPPAPPPPVADEGKKIDDFYPAWYKFLAAQTKRARKTTRVTRETIELKEEVKHTPGDGLAVNENAAKSWEEAASVCKAKVAAIVEECQRLNQKYKDALFDVSDTDTLQCLDGSYPDVIGETNRLPTYKRVDEIFDNPQFFIDGASASDVHQGRDGDCWFLAALMAICAKKELIDRLCVAREEKVGVYGFVFYKDGEWIHEVIDDKLFVRIDDDDDIRVVRDWSKDGQLGHQMGYDEDKLKEALSKGGEALYFSHCKSQETWLPLIEKAYAKAHGDYYAIEGGWASEGIEDLTGGVGVILRPGDIMDKDRFWKEQLSQVNNKYLFGGGSRRVDSKGIVAGHAYAILQAWEEGDLRLLKVRNPWGRTEYTSDWSDGSKQWTPEIMKALGHSFGDDGIFWIAYKDLFKQFPSISRVRIFDDSWTIAQQWTSVNIPWTVDYLDTKFQFTTSQKGPVVVVLAQPDDRYFMGLRGRYWVSMHFRVYKEGSDQASDRWLVRSMHSSGSWTVNTRSVSAEIDDLEPGTYDVIFKVTATRTDASTAAQVIKDKALCNKEKLLAVGRRYDYAMSKGNLKALEDENRRMATEEKHEKTRDGWKKARQLNKAERERARARKKRLDKAMDVQRRAIFERAKAKKAAEASKAAPAAADTKPESTDEAKEEKKDEPADVTKGVSDERETAAVASAVEKLDIKDEAPTGPTETSTEKTEDTPAEAAPAVVEDALAAPAEAPAPESTADAKEGEAPAGETAEAGGKAADAEKPAEEAAVPTTDLPPAQAEEEDSAYESPPEEPDDLDDDDFEWDSEIDGQLFSDDEDDGSTDPFADDPWTAVCVLGLRVYSQDKSVSVKVIKAANDA